MPRTKRKESKYWNEEVETMPREKLKQLQEAKLKKQIAYVYNHSPFHRKNFDEAGIKPDDIKTIDDLQKVPLTDKQKYAESQKENPPYGEMLCVSPEKIVRYWTTTGTTMKPRVFGQTLRDYNSYLETAARVLWTAGVRPGWKVGVMFPHGHWVGLWGVFDAAWMKIGAQVIALGGYKSEYRIGKISELGINCLCGTPTYIAYLSEVARENNLDTLSMDVRAACIAGEPSSPATRRMLEDTWGAKTFDFHGTTENMQYTGVDCEYQHGFHLWEDLLVAEIVDPQTGNRLPEGEIGELVYTNLTNQAMPAIRFRSGDLTLIERDVCPCGRTHNRAMYIMGRSENIVKVKGLNVYPRMAEEVLRSFSELGSEFRVVFERVKGLDAVRFQVEPLPRVQKGQYAALVDKIKRKSKELLGFTPEIELLAFGTLEKSELKAKRVIDRRDIYAR
jgi:phenylacetate-CoA ligase